MLTGNYDHACDMWSAGCILYILLCGYPPFYGDDDQEILRAVLRGKFEFEGEEWLEVSDAGKDLITRLICKPERRLTAEESLKHEWIRNYNIQTAFGPTKITGQKLNKINVDSLKKFQHHQKLKQAALTAIAVHLSPKDIAHLKEVFKNLDHNGDGCLNLEELRAGIADMRSGEDLMQLLTAADTDKNGKINYTGKHTSHVNSTGLESIF